MNWNTFKAILAKIANFMSQYWKQAAELVAGILAFVLFSGRGKASRDAQKIVDANRKRLVDSAEALAKQEIKTENAEVSNAQPTTNASADSIVDALTKLADGQPVIAPGGGSGSSGDGRKV